MSNDFLPHFRNSKLGLQALTDPSYVNENPGCGEDNERLEYLGDRIPNMIVSHSLYLLHPHHQEGTLTQMLSALVNNIDLAKLARSIDLGKHLRLGRGVELQNGRNNTKILSRALEAIIGAYFLDSGYQAASEYVDELFTLVTFPEI